MEYARSTIEGWEWFSNNFDELLEQMKSAKQQDKLFQVSLWIEYVLTA
jgi:hypothetical protein